jgi:N-acetylgalactosamine kinase
LGRLRSNRASQEEYLTDVFAILAKANPPAKIVGHKVEDPRDLMAFNNPQELLAIEEVYRQREGQQQTEESPGVGKPPLATVTEWGNLFKAPSAAAISQYRQWYGEEVPWGQFQDAIRAFEARFGPNRPVAIVRSPGRINLMGRHIDHQGGTVNVMAVNREIIAVAAPRNDDTVILANRDGEHFSEQTFRISDLVASLNWDDWQRVVDGPRLQRLLEAARGDWANYVKAAILRLQEQFRDRRLRGFDLMVSGDIPMGAGLSSSSALVVATADVVRHFNQLPVSARRLVSLCGEGEWFVGTRGGAADHAAIKLSRRGCVTRVGFFPFRIEDSARFFPDHVLIACNSGVYAGKSNKARNTFNAKVTAYHIGRTWFKMLRPDLATRIEHLRDITSENLGIPAADLIKLVAKLPSRLTRAQAQSALAQMAETERERLERLFLSHDAPAEGYAVQDVVLFGLSEMARARRCLELLKSGDAAGLGRLMNISHDGDRVSRSSKNGTWKRTALRLTEGDPEAWGTATEDSANIAELAGSYGCSLPELDRIVDLARRIPGVAGAQLAGAGLGGCIMVLAEKSQMSGILSKLENQGIRGDVFRPIAGACSLVMDR